MASIKYVFVVCKECGTEVDRVEYDDASASPAVSAVMDALGMDEADAKKLVKSKNPGAELSSSDAAHALAQEIADRSVKGRAKDTYVCRLGHKEGLEVSEAVPTPAVVTEIAKQES